MLLLCCWRRCFWRWRFGAGVWTYRFVRGRRGAGHCDAHGSTSFVRSATSVQVMTWLFPSVSFCFRGCCGQWWSLWVFGIHFGDRRLVSESSNQALLHLSKNSVMHFHVCLSSLMSFSCLIQCAFFFPNA